MKRHWVKLVATVTVEIEAKSFEEARQKLSDGEIGNGLVHWHTATGIGNLDMWEWDEPEE